MGERDDDEDVSGRLRGGRRRGQDHAEGKKDQPVRNVQGKRQGRSKEEEDACAAFISWCQWNAHAIPALKQVIHIPNGGERPSRVNPKTGARYSPEGARLKRMGAKAGVLDYLVAVPAWVEGEFRPGMWIEFKSKKGRMSKEQEEFANEQMKWGYVIALARSWTEGVGYVLQYLNRPEYIGRPN